MLDQLRADIDADRKAVLAHPLYARLGTEAAIVTFMEHHVWAVWDFMSLLKALQAKLTCVTVPWVPVGTPSARRLVNEIVTDEESDRVGPNYASHFELYLLAMARADADTKPVLRFAEAVRDGTNVAEALGHAPAPDPAARFVISTWAAVTSRKPHVQAAAFAFGREDLIPEMFGQVTGIGSPQLVVFADYLARHIELDERHGEMAAGLVAQLCGDDPARWAEATAVARASLRARKRLWDGVLAAIGLGWGQASPGLRARYGECALAGRADK